MGVSMPTAGADRRPALYLWMVWGLSRLVTEARTEVAIYPSGSSFFRSSSLNQSLFTFAISTR